MTGKLFDGHEAHRIGFANRIAPADQLDEATNALANELLSAAPRAVALAKRVMDAAAKPALAATLSRRWPRRRRSRRPRTSPRGARLLREARPGVRGGVRIARAAATSRARRP